MSITLELIGIARTKPASRVSRAKAKEATAGENKHTIASIAGALACKKPHKSSADSTAPCLLMYAARQKEEEDDDDEAHADAAVLAQLDADAAELKLARARE